MAERMTEKTFKMWRDRLAFAKNVWESNGLIGTREASTMRMLIDFYRGAQWTHVFNDMALLGADERATVNKIFPVANAMMGEVASRNPRVQVFPRNPESAVMALPVQHLLDYDIEEMDLKRQTNKALMHHLFAPAGFVQHGFTPEEETYTDSGRRMHLYRAASIQRPWVKARPIWNVLLDPTKESFHPDEGVEWVAFRDVVRLRDIKDNPNMIARDELKDFKGNISAEWKHLRVADYQGYADPDENELVELWSVYEARERTWFQMTLDGVDRPLRAQSDWPIPWETLPYSVLAVNEQMDTPFSLSLLDPVASIQVELNQLRTMMRQLVFRLRRIIGVQEAGIDNAELAKFENAQINEIIKFKGDPNSVMKTISSGVFPQELLQYNSLLEEDIREAVGQSKMGRAQRINVQTAHEVERVQQGQDIATARIVESYQNFNQDIIRLYMQGRRATMDITGPEIVRIVGQRDADGVAQWAEIDPAMLHGDYAFHVVPGSTLPRDKDRDAQKAGIQLQVAAASPDLWNLPYFLRRWVEANDLDPEQALSKESLVASKVRTVDQIRRNAGQGGEQAADGGGIDPSVAALISQSGGGGALQ